MRILHLAYEDPRRPGSGGGAVRTSQVNRRLAARHEITAVVAGYPGAQERIEHGIKWRPIGPRTGMKLDRLAYFALLAPVVARTPHDLVVEDFGAPFSVAGSPLFTRRPVVASVQWLFAREMRAKYRLPFDAVERMGLRLYPDYIVVSDWLGDRIRARRPGAAIETIPNGVDPALFELPIAPREHLLFLGRLDIAQKGGDILFDIYERILRRLGDSAPPLLVAGEGPDRAAMERRARRVGPAGRIRFLGHADAVAKRDLLARAHAVLMPSRHETFGMVAVEAQAAGAPVVAFDVGPLRAVAGGGDARLVAPFDAGAFAAAVVDLVAEPGRAAAASAAGRAWARRYDWDTIAEAVDAHYERSSAGT